MIHRPYGSMKLGSISILHPMKTRMKTKSTHLPMMLLLSVLGLIPVWAIRPPVDDAPPPQPVLGQDPDQRNAADMPDDPAPNRQQRDDGRAFLGVRVSEVPEMLAAQLELPEGAGVVVELILNDSPAQKVGLQKHDVLMEFAGKPLSSHDDLSQIITTHQPGDEVVVKYLRKGKVESLKVTLEQLPVQENPPVPLGQGGGLQIGPGEFFMEAFPAEEMARLRQLMGDDIGGFRFPDGIFGNELFQDGLGNIREKIEKMLADGQALEFNGDGGENAQFRMNAAATVRIMDQHGSIEMKAIDGGKEVTVRDVQNQIVWSGPWDTEQDKAAAPDDIRLRIENLNIDGLENGNGLKLQFFQND